MGEERGIITKDLEQEVKESYLRYSLSVIISRALPDVRDGLKPSQRRILYAMRQLRLAPGAKHRKCAKICGDTSGDYHPHGESVIYPTLARMAQSWVMRYPLVDGQGNFGSVDGDPPAQMRYTEARLTSASEKMMEDLEKETVEFASNYDETCLEPVIFPSKFPNLLCNGSSGIAVGMATNIPPHNIHELSKAISLLLKNPRTSMEEILCHLPGPDFPTGGCICGVSGIRDAFRTGRGKVILRGQLHTEENKHRNSIVITEIPYGLNKTSLITQMADLIQKKQIQSIADLRDESDREGMRIVLDLKRGEEAAVTINQLYAFTDLQTTFGCHLLALDRGLPRTMNIVQMLLAWIDHRMEVIRRRTQFELKKAEARAHVLEGYFLALSHLDALVTLIRSSRNREEAKQEMLTHYSFTNRQAEAILELRLYQLTGLEYEKLEQELQKLRQAIERYRALLSQEELVKETIEEELREICQRIPKGRKTEILPQMEELEREDLIPEEKVVITLSQDDYIKRMAIDSFREQKRGGQGVVGFQMRDEEDLIKNLYVVSTLDSLLFLTNQGRCYWLKGWEISETGRKSKGRPLINFLRDFRPQERVATLLPVSSFEGEGRFLVLMTKRGIIKKTPLAAFSNPRKKGIYALSIDEGDELISARLLSSGEQIMIFSRRGMAVRFDEDQVRSMGRLARGVIGIRLERQDEVVYGDVVSEKEIVLVACVNGFGKRSHVKNFRKTARGSKGVRSIVTSSRNGPVAAALSVSEEDSLLMSTQMGQVVRIKVKDLPIMSRSTQGVKLLQLKEEDQLSSLQKIAPEIADGE